MPMSRTLTASRAATALLAWALCAYAGAHQLPDNRATLVQRDAHHITLLLNADLPQVMHQVLAPKQAFAEFALASSSATPAQFNAAVMAMQKNIEQALRVVDGNGGALVVSNWVWPASAQLQAALRERAMALVVNPDDHGEAGALEVRADLRAAQPVKALRVQFPAALKRVMLVTYRPTQVWVEPTQTSALMTF